MAIRSSKLSDWSYTGDTALRWFSVYRLISAYEALPHGLASLSPSSLTTSSSIFQSKHSDLLQIWANLTYCLSPETSFSLLCQVCVLLHYPGYVFSKAFPSLPSGVLLQFCVSIHLFIYLANIIQLCGPANVHTIMNRADQVPGSQVGLLGVIFILSFIFGNCSYDLKKDQNNNNNKQQELVLAHNPRLQFIIIAEKSKKQ